MPLRAHTTYTLSTSTKTHGEAEEVCRTVELDAKKTSVLRELPGLLAA